MFDSFPLNRIYLCKWRIQQSRSFDDFKFSW